MTAQGAEVLDKKMKHQGPSMTNCRRTKPILDDQTNCWKIREQIVVVTTADFSAEVCPDLEQPTFRQIMTRSQRETFRDRATE